MNPSNLLRALCLIIFAFCMAMPAQVGADGQAVRSIFDYKHARWTVEQGAPPNITAIAQTPDGFLWLGSSNGLYRFDGVRFDPVAARPSRTVLSDSVNALLVLRSGTLLAGFNDGGLAVLRAGRLIPLRTPLPPDPIRELAQDRHGGVWVAHVGAGPGLAYLRAGRWQQIGPERGLPIDWVFGVKVAADGSVVAQSRSGLYSKSPDSPRFERVGANKERMSAFVVDASGRNWRIDDRRLVGMASLRTPSPAGPVTLLPIKGAGTAATADRDGNLWITTWANGLVRVRPGRHARVELMSETDGLSSNLTISSFQDGEGNVWVGTTNGLDQFRQASIVTERRIPAATDGLMVNPGTAGDVLVTDFASLYRLGSGRRLAEEKLPAGGVEVACSGPGSSVMLGAGSRFWRLQDGRLTELPAPPSRPTPRHLYQCATGADGVTWFAAMDDGVLAWDHGRWRHHPLNPLQRRNWAALLAVGPDARPIVYLNAGSLVRLGNAGWRRIWSTDSGGIGRLTSLHQGGDGLLLGGARGMARVRGSVRQRLSSADHPWLSSVVGIVEDSRGDTWILAAGGLARIRSSDLAYAFSHPKAPITVRMFDYADGLPGAPETFGKGNVAQGADGRIWLITSDRAAWIDPSRLPRNPVRPKVSITGLVVDGSPKAIGNATYLGTGPHDVTVRFTAPSLTIPDRVRFRYRLEGLDVGWRDATDLREAIYTHLDPGRYRLRVLASNNDGLWSASEASLSFVIGPTFFQTPWFFVALGLLLLLLAYAAAVIRSRHLLQRQRGILVGQMAERERIARDLHDTLLQSVQALILRFHAAVLTLPKDLIERRTLERTLDRAGEVLVEGRDRVFELRAQATPYDLCDALRELTETHLRGEVPFSFEVVGTPDIVSAAVGNEIQRIASEALFNAVKHAKATHLAIRLSFDRSIMTLRIADDGIGMEASRRAALPSDRHFGLQGMRERADRIGGALRIVEGPEGGVIVTLTMTRAKLTMRPT